MADGKALPALKKPREGEIAVFFDGLARSKAVPISGEELRSEAAAGLLRDEA